MKVFAHRGLHEGNPLLENSRRAVEEALASSADGLEVDLQFLADGRFLLYHDENLNPEHFDVPRPLPLNVLTLEEVRERAEVELLTLSDVLELDRHDKTVVLECKPSRNRVSYARALAQVLSDRTFPENVVLSSQDPVLLEEFRHRLGEAPLAPVMSRLNRLDRRRARDERWHELHLDETLCRSEQLQENPEIDPERVVAWTVNDPSRRQKLERLGIKGIMTDNSELFS